MINAIIISVLFGLLAILLWIRKEQKKGYLPKDLDANGLNEDVRARMTTDLGVVILKSLKALNYRITDHRELRKLIKHRIHILNSDPYENPGGLDIYFKRRENKPMQKLFSIRRIYPYPIFDSSEREVNE